MKHILSSLLLTFVLVAVWAPQNAYALASDWAEAEHAKARLISAVDATGEQELIRLGIEIEMTKNWKTYWRMPGDSGLAPAVDWAGSSNLKDSELMWPAPHRFSAFGFDNFGYKDKVIFPVEVTVEKTGAALDLKAKLDLLVCDDICVPSTHQLALTIPAGDAKDSVHLAAIDKALAQVPATPLADQFAFGQAYTDESQDPPQLVIDGFAAKGFSKPDLFIETPEAYSFGKPEWRYDSSKKTFQFRVPVLTAVDEGETLQSMLGEELFALTFVDEGVAYEGSLALSAVPVQNQFSDAAYDSKTAGAFALPSLVTFVLMAFVGGLILNIMPCVLPILSIKILSFIKHSASEQKVIRKGFMAAAFGILSFFILLAGILAVLKISGEAVGWGIQFQQPLFLVGIFVILVLFALNMWGAYDIPLPRFIADHLPKSHEHEPTMLGHYLTGVFAAILATPCTAPFLGTAVGFALSGGVVDIFVIFIALGLGLAAPYILVALVPAIARIFPKPGAWMVTVKKIMAVALLATAVWILSVLMVTVGVMMTLYVAGIMGMVSVLVLLKDKIDHKLRMRGIVILTALIFVMIAIIPDQMLEKRSVEADSKNVVNIWQPFDRMILEQKIKDGRVVLVDVTADWCLTCKANKKFVLETDEMRAFLVQHQVVTLMADWTKPDDVIQDYLASFGKFGIPFNVVYGPNAPDGIVLPELLTPSAVKEAIEKAK
jgi:suppressor for copper-sensitivity B